MARTVQMEYLRPDEIREEQKRISLCYLPVGPVEWHSLHMPMGTDGLAAQGSARAAAALTGGVVAPTLFIGAERHDPDALLDNLRVPHDESSYIWGMNFPNTTLPSMYFREEVFATVIREELRLLSKMGFRMIVVMNGHGAIAQVDSVRRLCDETTHETDTLCVMADWPSPRLEALMRAEKTDPGHADRLETSMMMAQTDAVDLGQLPPRIVPMRSADYGVASGCQFAGRGSDDGVIPDDPRDATAELGRRLLEAGAQDDAEHILALYRERIG